MAFRRRKTEWSREPDVLLDIKSVGASRAMFVDENTQMVRVQFMTTDNQQVAMELTVHQAALLIEQATSAYYAIVPQLRTSRGIPF